MTFSSSKLYKPALVLMAVALLFSVSFTQRGLNVKREKLGLTRVAPLENAPPVLAFTTVALGGFRGLIANMLWIRANDLQEQDKFFEMVQLADWITKLQPYFVTVWVHQAWNMAYNISIKFTDPNDRWQWVRRGIELLRDEGLKYNPTEPLIYRELAWFFQHKMGANLDDAHNYYKAVWVEEMTQVLGSSRPNFDELINPQTPEAKARVELLTGKYKMDARWLKEVDDRYGPLEWRLPESHAIYWAVVGLEKTRGNKLKKDDLMTLRRVIFQSLQLAFNRGRLVFPNKTSGEFIYAPNLDIVSRANDSYLEMMEQEPTMRDNIANGHKNFVKKAIYFLYIYNRQSQASQWWKYLHEKYPAAVPPNQELDQYALERATETIGETSHDDSKAIIESFLANSFIHLALDEDDVADSYQRFALKVHERFQASIGKQSEKRVGLPDLSEMKREVLNRLLDPETGLENTMAAQLRTKLGLPAASAPAEVPKQSGANPSTDAGAAKVTTRK